MMFQPDINQQMVSKTMSQRPENRFAAKFFSKVASIK
jgi:hypothetical protein